MPSRESAWLGRLRHDLIKRLLWPARDRRDAGGPVVRGELVPRLVDGEGAPIAALALWQQLRAEAPDPAAPALATFQRALEAVVAAAERDDLGGVLALEGAFTALAAELSWHGRTD